MSNRAIHIIGPVIMMLAGILLTEFALRIVPSPIRSAPMHEFGDPDSLLGIEMVPGAEMTTREPCYASRVSINSLGWRDRERSVERVPGKARIAVLGDSFTVGTQVNDHETLTRQLESMLGEENVEVLSFGMSSIGTVQQEILYEHVVAAYDPDIVLVGFYTNDVQNSTPLLESTTLTFRSTDGELVSERSAGPFFGLRKWLRVHSATFRLVKFAQQRIGGIFATDDVATESQAQLPKHFVIYTHPLPAEWEQGWQHVKDAFRRLKNHMKPHQTLLVFAFPDVLQVAHDPAALVREEYGIEAPSTFSPRSSYDRLYSIVQEEQISAIETLPALLAVRDREGLEYPYFSHTCDGHYSAFGLRALAEILVPRLTPLLRHD